MAYSENPPTIDNIISFMPEDDISNLNSLYEEMLKTKVSSINEAVRTETVKQNKDFPGIAGPIYGAGSPESTINIQTGKTTPAGSDNIISVASPISTQSTLGDY